MCLPPSALLRHGVASHVSKEVYSESKRTRCHPSAGNRVSPRRGERLIAKCPEAYKPLERERNPIPS